MTEIRFSEHFGLQKSQWELDFIDIPINSDIQLYVDPYAISISESIFCQECNDMIITYFTLVVRSIKEKNDSLAKQLLLNLHEPNDTHLGMSSGKPQGRGIGGVQGSQLFQAFKSSKAAKTGYLNDINDCILFIDGIGRDKISDITTNIIKQKLIEYTKEQCNLHDIPTRNIGTGKYFDFSDYKWKNRYEELPHYNGERILLVPKDAVRRTANISPEKYYNFVIDYLQTEHEVPGDSLVNVLKNGKLKVYKKDLKEEYPYSREWLFQFTLDNPDVYTNFKSSSARKANYIDDYEIESRQEVPKEFDPNDRIQLLKEIKTGKKQADDYHNAMIGIVSMIFGDRLRRPRKEQKLYGGRKKIDITYENAKFGFFYDLVFLHEFHCPYIHFECKNYTEDIVNPEMDQLLGRFNDRVGSFGILLCRKIKNKSKLAQHLKDIATSGKGTILILEDKDLITMLELKAQNKEQEIDDYMTSKLKEVMFE